MAANITPEAIAQAAERAERFWNLETVIAPRTFPTPRSTDGDRGGRGDLIQCVRGNPNSHYKLWQTPVADDAVDREAGKVNSRGEPKLSAQVKLWPTPDTCAGGSGPSQARRNQPRLQDAVTLSVTPKARDHKDGACRTDSAKNWKGDLGKQVLWPTPCASDNRDRGNLSDPAVQRSIEIGKQVGLTMAAKDGSTPGSLNPDWVELLMGWPMGWAALDKPAAAPDAEWADIPARWQDGTWEDGVTRVAQGVVARVDRLRCIGNGQVPHAAAMAWRILTA